MRGRPCYRLQRPNRSLAHVRNSDRRRHNSRSPGFMACDGRTCETPRRSVTSGQRYAGGSTAWNSWPPTTRRSIGVSSSRVAQDTGCVRRGHRSLVPSSLLAHNGEFTRRRCQTSADSFVFCSVTTTPGRTRKRARASCSPPRPHAALADGHPSRDGRRLWRTGAPSNRTWQRTFAGKGFTNGPHLAHRVSPVVRSRTMYALCSTRSQISPTRRVLASGRSGRRR